MDAGIRVRFAPSPTGHVHIGNIRVAIFNWLFARHAGGSFLLRVEDTDRERSTPEAVRAVLDAMAWLGLTFDEEPLYQSTRTEAHIAAADLLLSRGLAYKEDKGGTGKGECVLFRMPGRDMSFCDEVKGELRKEAKDLADFVIVRSDGSPIFHLANVVDDIEMGITHIIRGDDHVENTFRHLALFEALGATPPRYAHLPMIVNEQGRPYSKRDGAAFVGDFREKGYLPEALLNFLALLGWSPGGDLEIMSREQMVSLFDVKRVNSAPARMDMKKLEWMNGEYMRQLPVDVFQAGFRLALQQASLLQNEVPEGYLEVVAGLMQERTKVYGALPASVAYFFTDDFAYDDKAVRKRLLKDGVPDVLRDMRQCLEAGDVTDTEATEGAVRAYAEERGMSVSAIVHPLRVATSGIMAGPGLFEMLAVLGKERVIERIDKALALIEERVSGAGKQQELT